jgi:co-chaperonin GroES (HSP10)
VIRPTGHRILIQPDQQPEADGAILLPQHRDFVATSGTVIAMGPRGSKVRWDARQRALQQAVEALKEMQKLGGADRDSAHERVGVRLSMNRVLELIGSPDSEHEITVGDRVAFDSESGLRINENGVEYLIMNEDDVVVIVEESESAA